MISKLIEVSSKSPEDTTGSAHVVAVFTAINNLIATRNFSDDFKNNFVLAANLVIIFSTEARKPESFTSQVTEILSQLNQALVVSSALSDIEKNQCIDYLVSCLDNFSK
jgi:hypothetical protein